MSILREIRKGNTGFIGELLPIQIDSVNRLRSTVSLATIDASIVGSFIRASALEALRVDENRTKKFNAEEFPCAFSGHPHYWIEGARVGEDAIPGAVEVVEVSQKRLELTLWFQGPGRGSFVGGWAFVELDEDGGVIRCAGKMSDEKAIFCEALVAFALTTLCWMNCPKSFEVVSIPTGKNKKHHPRPLAASVWRTIRICNDGHEKLRGGRNAFPDEECRVRRCHFVRGHYRDYRHGAGMWGNPKLKILIWVAGYERGDESLGRVIQEYVINAAVRA